MSVELFPGDCLEIIPRLVAEGRIVDAVVCDPPYHLTSTVARFGGLDINADTKTSRRIRTKGDGMSRMAQGFMNQTWDGGDIAFRPETWATIGTIMRPGAFLLAFGGTRTFHRIWCAIEDAGFVMQDTICWMYGSGFPKRRDALKPAWEPVCVAYKPAGKRSLAVDECRVPTEDNLGGGAYTGSQRHDGTESWRFRNGGAKGVPGKRTLQVDECRVPTEDGKPAYSYPNGPGGMYSHEYQQVSDIAKSWNNFSTKDDNRPSEGSAAGRWPANVILDNSDEVMEAFAAYGERSSGNRKLGNYKVAGGSGIYGDFGNGDMPGVIGDSGSPARFFYSSKAGDLDRWSTLKHELTISWISESGPCQAVLLVATALSPPRVTAASPSMDVSEWNTFLFGSGLTELFQKASKPTIRMKINSTIDSKTWSWLTRSLTSEFIPDVISSTDNGSNLAENAENTSLSISFILAETASLPHANRAVSGGQFEISGREKNGSHPTVKPVSLISYLVKLVCPPNGVFLDCFAGSGTAAVAALATGRNAILIEQDANYVSDIKERIAFYEGETRHSLASKARHAAPSKSTAEDLPLFSIGSN